MATSTGCSTICSTGTSGICTSSKMPLCCINAPCGRTSTNGAGRVPGGGGFWRRGATCSTRSSTTPALVTVLWPRKASYAVGPYEWCSTVARAIAIDIRSCRHHERSRRSRRRLAAPARSYSMAQPLETTAKEQVRTLVLLTLTVSALTQLLCCCVVVVCCVRCVVVVCCCVVVLLCCVLCVVCCVLCAVVLCVVCCVLCVVGNET